MGAWRSLSKIGNALVLAVCLAGATALVGCPPPSKVAQGQRYSSGDNRFDPYFDSVHQQQVAAASWPDDRKAARRPLVTALALTPDANEDTILHATRERAKKMGGQGAKLDLTVPRVSASPGAAPDASLFLAVEETARAEQDRVKKLKATSEKLEEMAKQGEPLKRDADKDIENAGAQKADDTKMAKRREVRIEIMGAMDALRTLARDANRSAKEDEEFLEDLGSALEAKETPKRTRGGSMGSDRKPSLPAKEEAKPAAPPPPPSPPPPPPKEEPKHGKSPPAKPAAPPPTPAKKPAAPPAEKPAPAEKPGPAEKPAPPPQKPPDEVFQP